MNHGDRAITFSFRLRMTVVMTGLLVGTLVTVQYLNQKAQLEIQDELDEQKDAVGGTIDEQSQNVIAATNFALTSLWENDYIYNLIATKYPNAINRAHIRHILIIKSDGEIYDANEEYFRKKFVRLPATVSETTNLPGGITQKGFDPVAQYEHETGPSDTYWFWVKTKGSDETSEFYWIAIVVSTEQVTNSILKSQQEIADVIKETADTRLKATLGVFALAVGLMILLVWRFTRPLRLLSEAAVRVARGDLNFTVAISRRDETGQLARTFNDMIGGLKAKAELEERLNNAERAAVIGRLTAAIAHEIRNPLNFINLSIDHARTKFAPAEPKDRERFERLLGSIKEEVGRLNRLVTDVLNFGRPANLNTRTFDLRGVIDQVLSIVRTQADEQGVEIDVDLPAEPVEIEADAEKLKSCFSNIVINAVQAMPDGGRLTVSLARAGDQYRIRFADTGTGIPEEALDRVFEPYYSTKDTGTGLGLAVTKKIIDEHGGRVSIVSALGKGTTFEVDLPRARHAVKVLVSE